MEYENKKPKMNDEDIKEILKKFGQKEQDRAPIRGEFFKQEKINGARMPKDEEMGF